MIRLGKRLTSEYSGNMRYFKLVQVNIVWTLNVGWDE